MYLKMVDEFEKELIARGIKISPELHDARFDFALWLEKKSAHNRASCPIHGHDWNYMCSMCVAAANASR